jgi:uncharacterized protein YndB with AHSA1/START domain
MKADENTVVVEQIFKTSSAKVWSAITNVEEMTLWFFDNIPSFKAEVGFKTRFLIQSEGRKFTHLWEVTEVIPNHKITYNWKYEEYPGDAFVTFELFEEEKQVRLKLTMHVTEDFPDNIPEFTWDSCIEGWRYFIIERLKIYLHRRR